MILEIRQDPTKWPPNPGGQADFFHDFTHRYCALAGGWYSGKTFAGARKFVTLQVFNAFDEHEQPTFVKGLVVGQTYGLAASQVIPELEAAFDEANLRHKFIADTKKYWFELPDLGTRNRPSLVFVRSADAPETINSFTVGHVWGDEAGRWRSDPDQPKRDPFVQTYGRVRDPKARVQQINLTFTHEGDETRVYQDFIEEPKPGHAIYIAATTENPSARQFAAEMKSVLTPELAKQYLAGLAAKLRGAAVYSSFGDRNLQTDLQWVPGLPLHVAVDFNINPGMHAILGQHVPQADLLTAMAEIHEKDMDVRRMMVALKDLLTGNGRLAGIKFSELIFFGDASGENRWAGTGEKCWDVVRSAISAWKASGWNLPVYYRVPRENPYVSDRVATFNCALMTADNRVRYKVHPDCKLLLRDFRQMKWKDGELDKRDRKLSHPSDADGYRVYMLMPIRKPTMVSIAAY